MDAPTVPPSEELTFRCTVQTRWSDEDKVGVVNNAVFLNLLEEARFRYFQDLGLYEKKAGFGFLLGQTNIRFLSPAHGPAQLTVEMATTHVGNRSFHQAYRVLDSSGLPLAEAEAAMVWWDSKTKSTADTPDVFRQAMASTS
ncbi:MAG: acyl-CoA thioesterase [Planctomycetota bacterium]|jgi:acyl-CoA thioesterase FadM|nr:acyl-CoA thioesterase [Planctomycetota bacterium]